MKLKVIAVVILSVVSLAMLPGCAATGNNLAGFWNNPAVQAELAQIEQEAIGFATTFITTHLGAAHPASTAASSAIDKAVAAIEAKHPQASVSVIRDTVTAKFAEPRTSN